MVKKRVRMRTSLIAQVLSSLCYVKPANNSLVKASFMAESKWKSTVKQAAKEGWRIGGIFASLPQGKDD